MNCSTLSLLCLLAWSLPFTSSFLSVERCKGLAEIRNPFSSTLWTGFRLTSLHTVILWCTMRCPMILSMIDQPSGRASGVCLFRKSKESCGNSPRRRANEHAGLSTDGAWIMAGCPPGSWPQFCRVQWKLRTWQCWEFTVGSEAKSVRW